MGKFIHSDGSVFVSAGTDNMAGDSKVVCPTGDFIVKVLAGRGSFKLFEAAGIL